MVTAGALQIFDGVMLSDGTLCLSSARSTNPGFKLALSGWNHLDWISCVQSALGTLNISSKVHTSLSRSKGKAYEYCQVRSNTSLFLTQQKRRWYPNGIKEVPIDLCLTPISLAHWFMGDGSSTWNNFNHDAGVTADFATQNFSPYSIDRLEHQLELLGLTHLSRRDYSKRSSSKENFAVGIVVLGASLEPLMDLVEPYILPSYKYKIKRPGGRVRYGSQR